MGILNLFPFVFLFPGSHIGFPMLRTDIFLGALLSLFRNTGGICTQVCDHTYRSGTFQIHSLVKLLRQAHGLLGGEIKHFAGFLLQGGGGKRQRSLSGFLTVLYLTYPKGSSLQFLLDLQQLSLGRNVDLFLQGSVIMCCHGLFLPFDRKLCIQSPVFFRNKCIDLIFSVTDDTKGN